MSKRNDALFTILHKLFDFCRIEPEMKVFALPEQAFSGRMNNLGSERPRFITQREYNLSLKADNILIGTEKESRGLGCAIFAVSYAFFYGDARLKSILVVHKNMEEILKAAKEDEEIFGKFNLGHRVCHGINLQHIQSESIQGFQIRLADIKDPLVTLTEIARIFREQVPSLKFKTNKKNFHSTGVITIPVDKEHQIEIYLEKKT